MDKTAQGLDNVSLLLILIPLLKHWAKKYLFKYSRTPLIRTPKGPWIMSEGTMDNIRINGVSVLTGDLT